MAMRSFSRARTSAWSVGRAVSGRVLIYIHKRVCWMTSNSDIQPGILAEMKKVWGNGLTPIFPSQGNYVLDPTTLLISTLVTPAVNRTRKAHHESESIRRKAAQPRHAGQRPKADHGVLHRCA